MRILITGASGMLGATLSQLLQENNEVYATGNSTFKEQPQNYKVFDLQSNSYDELISWSNPDVIILSGALTNGNYCSENPNEAFSVNGVSVHKFIKATRDSVKLIYISTDAVFPSKLHLAKETDCVSPENVYGKSKELGEFFTLSSHREFTIIRTTIVGLNINSAKSGFVEWIIKSALNRDLISLFSDVLFNPISIWELTKEIQHLITLESLPNEVLHISGKEIASKHQFGIELLNILGMSNKSIKSGSINDLKHRAKRCNDQTIDCSYYQKKYKRKLPSLKDTLLTIKQNYESN